MTRRARDDAAAEAALRGERAWATQAYLNLLALVVQLPPSPTRDVLSKFATQAPPSIKAAAQLVLAERGDHV